MLPPAVFAVRCDTTPRVGVRLHRACHADVYAAAQMSSTSCTSRRDAVVGGAAGAAAAGDRDGV
jgi:hypothetical protein